MTIAREEFANRAEAMASAEGFDADSFEELLDWFAGLIIGEREGEAQLNAIATALSFTGSLSDLPGFVVELVQKQRAAIEQGERSYVELRAQYDELRTDLAIRATTIEQLVSQLAARTTERDSAIRDFSALAPDLTRTRRALAEALETIAALQRFPKD